MKEAKSFEEILASLLKKYEKEKLTDMNSFLKEQSKGLELTEDNKKMLELVFYYLDNFDKNQAELKEAQNEKGISRKRWFGERVEKKLSEITEKEEDKAALMKVISDNLSIDKLEEQMSNNRGE